MNCRSCGKPALVPVLDLGDQYLPDFTEPGAGRGPRFPLELMHCGACTLLQLRETAPRAALYHERYGFRSGVNEAIRADLEDVVKYALAEVPAPKTWLDIACNDGTLLSFVPRNIRRIGIDPLTQFAAPAGKFADQVISSYFAPQFFQPGEFGVITSVSMFYDLDDPNEFVAGVASVLDTHGIWVIQQNYAADMLARNAVDNVCHEHVTYFSVTSLAPLLARHGLEISEVTYSDVNGGCFRTLVSHRGRRPAGGSVRAAMRAEHDAGLSGPDTFRRWGQRVSSELMKTRLFLEAERVRGRDVFLYGASTRGGTFLQMIEAGPSLLPFAVERNPAKVGKIMAATGIPIISEEQMRADPPDALLVSPWFFREVFLEREAPYLAAGGRMAFPLPQFEVTGG